MTESPSLPPGTPEPPAELTPLQQAQAAQAAGRLTEAAAWYEQVLALAPADHASLVQLGVVRIQLGQHAAAAQALSQALALRPEDAFARYNLGNALYFQGDLGTALAQFQQAVQHDASFADAHHNLGFVQEQLGLRQEALRSYEKAVACAPRAAHSWFSLGIARSNLGQASAALAAYDRALQIDPAFAKAHLNRGTMLQNLGRLEQALQSFEAARRHDPKLDFITGAVLFARLRLGRWEGLPWLVQPMLDAVALGRPACHPFTLQVVSDNPALQLQAARTWMDRHHPGHDRANDLSPAPVDGTAPRRVRIGYFSPDFYDHPVARLMVEVLEHHDRQRFEVLCFSLGGKADAITERVRRASDRFIDMSAQADPAVVEAARREALDIAIDLSGHTLGSRTGIFARRVAPVQASYIGYLGTMGSPCYDYLLADATLVPPGEEGHFAEKLARLPVYQANPAQRDMAPQAPTRAELKLPEQGVVFCVINNTYKILPETFARWWRILQQVPGSVLYLVAETVDAGEQLRENACALGVEASRIIIGRRLRYAEYMARLQVPDLLLDTFPYPAGTTASDALWAGLPVLTLRGRSFASRMAASVLNAAGLQELVTDTPEAFEATAVALGRDPQRLQALKERLRQEMPRSPLFDPARFTRTLESALQRMFDRALQGLPPRHLTVTAEDAEDAAPPAAQPPALQLQQALARHQAGDVDAAEDAYLALLRQDPANAEAAHLLGVAQHQRGDIARAAAWIERAIALAPAQPVFHDNIVKLHELTGQPQQALQCLDRALQALPGQAHWWVRRGVLLQALGRPDEALASHDRALALDAQQAEAHFQRGRVLGRMGRDDEALASFDHALALQPDAPGALLNKATALLRQGNYAHGFELFESRWQVAETELQRAHPTDTLWLGDTPLQGRTLLLHCEQSLGDTLQFCRYAVDAADAGARVVLQVQPGLVSLIKTLDPRCLCIGSDEPAPPFDLHTPLMSLPRAFRTTLQTVPRAEGYLHCPPDTLQRWAALLGAATRPRIGLAWSGRRHPLQPERSIPLDTLIQGLGLGAEDALAQRFEFVSLHRELPEADLQTLARHPHIRHFGTEQQDFADAAALCAHVELVITIDTSLAHLAGALGRPTWVLLPQPCDWRWMLGHPTTPWYHSIRLHRQTEPGRWEGLLQQVHNSLNALPHPA
jgi:predicted O-linked N-acetylglucosamine transferase (SPINDLY family)